MAQKKSENTVTLTLPLPPLMTVQEAAKYLGVCRDTVDRWAKRKGPNALKRTKFGWLVRYKLTELQRFVDVNTRSAEAEERAREKRRALREG